MLRLQGERFQGYSGKRTLLYRMVQMGRVPRKNILSPDAQEVMQLLSEGLSPSTKQALDGYRKMKRPATPMGSIRVPASFSPALSLSFLW